MKVLEELLENYWILNDQDNEKYEQIRQELDDKTVNFIKQKLGYKLIINPYLIKLEKICIFVLNTYILRRKVNKGTVYIITID